MCIDLGHRRSGERDEARGLLLSLRLAKMPCNRLALNLEAASGQRRNPVERVKAEIRAKVANPSRVIRCQFVFKNVRCRALAKYIWRARMLFALYKFRKIPKELLD